MRLLVSGATAVVNEQRDHRHLGLLAVPAAGNAPEHYRGWTWAADNGAFSGFDERAFLRMLDNLKGVDGCMWVACPDVVGDAQATLDLFYPWAGRLRADGWPVALVAQDGLENQLVPWDRFDCLFIGGSTDWKVGQSARHLVGLAKRHGKLVHVGRVNTPGRIRYCASIGVDSIDGTQWSRFSRIYLAGGLAQIQNLVSTPQLELEESA